MEMEATDSVLVRLPAPAPVRPSGHSLHLAFLAAAATTAKVSGNAVGKPQGKWPPPFFLRVA